MGLGIYDIKYVINRISNAMEENKAYLTELDSAIGDADHGINMSKGFRAVENKLTGLEADDIGSILKSIGMTLVTTVGGASGPLYGTAFMRAGAAVSGKKEIDLNDFISMVSQALEGIKMRGKAALGDKTMVDAIEPALNSLIESKKMGTTTIEALKAASDSAMKGALNTKEIQAKKGRASYLGQRSIGHQDPGATSSYIMFKSIYEAVLELKNRN